MRNTGLKKTKELEEFIKTYHITANNSKDAYRKFCEGIPIYEKGMHDTIINTANSSVGTGLLLSILSGGNFGELVFLVQ